MEEFGKPEERVVLVGVQTGENDNVEESLDELRELASTAGAVTVGRIVQNREAIHPGTYIGKGKIEEVRALVYAMDATGIICDDELSPAQVQPVSFPHWLWHVTQKCPGSAMFCPSPCIPAHVPDCSAAQEKAHHHR